MTGTRCLALAVLLSTAACGTESAPAPRYLEDASYRRQLLEESLVNPANDYAALRLEHYGSGTRADWERLPEWNPPVEPVRAADLADGRLLESPRARASALDLEVDPNDAQALIALGREAFSRYPAQLAPYLANILKTQADPQRYGLWQSSSGELGGLVRVALADGSSQLALTCSSCHARQRGDSVELGPPNAELDLGQALVDAAALGAAEPAEISGWGRGRVDVTTTRGDLPQAIPDLRPLHFLTRLHHEANVSLENRDALAVRIETLVIESSGLVIRPPRLLSLALSRYLETLQGTLPDAELAATAAPRGAALFASTCASCHTPPNFTGPPVPLDIIGTDPALGTAPARTTGTYRVPSLHGVGTRDALLHDGTLRDVASLLDPRRLQPDFNGRLHGSGAVLGHEFGLELSEEERRELVAFVAAL